jgi:hypothetical protein
MDNRLLDPKHQDLANVLSNEESIVNAIELLEDLAAAFKRNITPGVRSEIRRHQRRFDSLYEVSKDTLQFLPAIKLSQSL